MSFARGAMAIVTMVLVPSWVVSSWAARDGDGKIAAAVPSETNETVILRTSQRFGPIRTASDVGTVWRYHETWQTDVARLNDGRLVNVDIFDGARRKAESGEWEIQPAKRVRGSAFPPAGWEQPDFDDSAWVRHPGPFPSFYRSLALICLRGKFHVNDPANVSILHCRLRFQGGAVVWLNGEEVGRGGLPAGPISARTLAEDYPHETWLNAAGKYLEQYSHLGGRVIAPSEPWFDGCVRNPETAARQKRWTRHLDLALPARLLRKGVNVLAIEVHRSPADPIMFTAADLTPGNNSRLPTARNRAMVEDAVLSFSGAPDAVDPNLQRPAGLQVWNEGLFSVTDGLSFGDANEPLRPVRLRGVKNGAYAAQVVVGSRAPIKGLTAQAGELRNSAGQAIPASSVQVTYLLPGGCGNDTLDAVPPTEVPTQFGDRPITDPRATAPLGAVQPVWVTVRVPADAPAGEYAGQMAIRAEGEKAIAVPLQMRVVGDWVLPDSKRFVTVVSVIESPESVAMKYGVPMWSDAHWRLLDRVFERLGEIGAKDVYLTLVPRTSNGLEHGMVRWIRQPDGTWTHDFSIAQRYLDTAIRHLGKPPVVCLWISDVDTPDARGAWVLRDPPIVTQVDPSTRRLTELAAPKWGTPESVAFWKPVLERLRAMLVERGLEKSLMFGISANNSFLAKCLEDLHTLAPEAPWVNRSHFSPTHLGDRNGLRVPVGLTCCVGGAVDVHWDPDDDPPNYGWTSARLLVHFPRTKVSGACLTDASWPSAYRMAGEGSLLFGGRNTYEANVLNRGIGHIGADLWPVLRGGKGPMKTLAGRYGWWGSLTLFPENTVAGLLGPGVDGPAPTRRHQMLRESLQDAEARIFVQNALLDEAQRSRLGPELADKCKTICDERTRALRYFSAFSHEQQDDDYAKVCPEAEWQERAGNLYEAASEVARALRKN